MRASDRDRDVALNVLAQAYADGRLDREEYDERVRSVGAAKTLGELPPAVSDLVPASTARHDELVHASDEELHRRAVRAYEARRREALSGLVFLSLVLTGIWFAVSRDGFYWPVFVLAFAGANLVRLMIQRQDVIEKEQHRLEAKRRRGIEPPQPDA